MAGLSSRFQKYQAMSSSSDCGRNLLVEEQPGGSET